MKTKTINLLSFDELNDEQKAKVIENNRDINTYFDGWYSHILEDFEVKLAEAGFINPKIYFSGFWSQGDGACFDAEIDAIKFLSVNDKAGKFSSLLEFINDGDLVYSIAKNGYANHYSHEKTRYVTSQTFFSDEAYNSHAVLIDELSDLLEDHRLQWCNEIYKGLETCDKYLTSDEAIAETLIANEYTFNEETLAIEN